MTLKDPELPK